MAITASQNDKGVDMVKGMDPVSRQVYEELVTRYPDLTFSDFDTGIAGIDFSKKPRKTISPKPDGQISPQEVRNLALSKAKDEYVEWVACRRDKGADGCAKASDLLIASLNTMGIFIPWFFYSEKKLDQAIAATSFIRNAWEENKDLQKAGLALYDLITSPDGFGVRYDSRSGASEAGVDQIVERKMARCEELGFMLKGLALVIGMPEPNIYDEAGDEGDVDHVYSSFSLGGGLELFLDPLVEDPFVASSHPQHGDAVRADSLHLLGVFEMNATSRNCQTRECGLERAKRALAYSPIFRNFFLLGNEYMMSGKLAMASYYYREMCKLNPFYAKCSRWHPLIGRGFKFK